MKTIIPALILLTLASSASAKSRVQYEVCAIDGGKLGVYEVTDKRPQAMAIASYLEGKTHKHYFVVVEEVTAKGDTK